MSELSGYHIPEEASVPPENFAAVIRGWDAKINQQVSGSADEAIVSALAVDEINRLQGTVGEPVIFWGRGLYLAPGTKIADRRYSLGDGGGRPAVGVSHGATTVPMGLPGTSVVAKKLVHEIRFPGETNGRMQQGAALFQYEQRHFMPRQAIEASFKPLISSELPLAERLYLSTVQRRVDIMAKKAYYLDIDDTGQLAELTPLDITRKTLGAHCLSIIKLAEMREAWPWREDSLIVPEDVEEGQYLCLDLDGPTRTMLGVAPRKTLYVPTLRNIVNYEVRDNVATTGGQS